ncbi:MAG TPA: class I SAM-dependent methyltransferase [Steroidobacteraceae bacterium]|nr:class I SAM-dependent methyltransferase [Steroidobacteraceae bacterium]
MQGQFWGEATLEVLARAGIEHGMRVLDLGSGAGDVAMLVASLVGETGSVLGIDRAVAAVEAANQRVVAAGLTNVEFRTGSIENLELEDSFDAVVGRLVLMYLKDPAASLGAIARRLLKRPGIVAFMEFDMEAARQVPTVPLINDAAGWIRETFRRAGNSPTLGPRLPQVFRAAGLPEPQLIARARIQVAPAIECTQYTTATIRSLLPMMEQLGVVRADEVKIDTLARRMQEALVAADASLIMPTLIGAWARLPESSVKESAMAASPGP